MLFSRIRRSYPVLSVRLKGLFPCDSVRQVGAPTLNGGTHGLELAKRMRTLKTASKRRLEANKL